MKVIEKGKFENNKIRLEDLKKVNGGFCGTYNVCNGKGSSCSPLVGGTWICLEKTTCTKIK